MEKKYELYAWLYDIAAVDSIDDIDEEHKSMFKSTTDEDGEEIFIFKNEDDQQLFANEVRALETKLEEAEFEIEIVIKNNKLVSVNEV